MPIINPRVPGDLPYPFRTAIGKAPLNFGGVTEITIGGAGVDYLAGDELVIAAPPSGGIQARAQITTVDGSGTPLTITIINPGAGYTVAPAVSGGSGTLATFTAVLTGAATVPVSKGNVYVSDDNGRLINPPTALSVVDLSAGIMQAIETTVIGDGNEFVQVVTPPGRIILLAPAGLKKNDRVDLAALDADNADQDKVVEATEETAYLGRIFEIETKNTDGSVKLVTEEDDKVVIDLGVI